MIGIAKCIVFWWSQFSLPSLYTGKPLKCTTAPVSLLLLPPQGPSHGPAGWWSGPPVEGSPAAGPPAGHERRSTLVYWRHSHPAKCTGTQAEVRISWIQDSLISKLLRNMRWPPTKPMYQWKLCEFRRTCAKILTILDLCDGRISRNSLHHCLA